VPLLRLDLGKAGNCLDRHAEQSGPSRAGKKALQSAANTLRPDSSDRLPPDGLNGRTRSALRTQLEAPQSRRAEFIRPATEQERRLLLSPLQECFAALRRQQVPHLLQRGQGRIAVRQGSR